MRTPQEIKGFINAMENAHKKKAKKVVISRTYSEASIEDIRKMFGEGE